MKTFAASVIAPIRPVKIPKTRRGGKFYYTIHVHPNQAFGLRVNDNELSAIVGFKNENHALFIGKMIELNYIEQQELPSPFGQLVLPMSDSGHLEFLFLQKWDFEDLKTTCTKNFLNMVSIDNIGDNKKGFKLAGEMLLFTAPREFYIDCLKEIYDRPARTPDV